MRERKIILPATEEEEDFLNPIITLSAQTGRSAFDIPKVYGFEVRCPYCRTRLRFKRWGKRVRCGACGKAFVINERGTITPREEDKKRGSIKRGRHDLRHQELEQVENV